MTARHGKLEDMHKTLFLGGDVYSPADPFATAMLIDGDSVAWVGSDEAARAVGDSAEVVELDGALVTPAFVDALADGSAPDAASAGAARGVAAVHITVGADDVERFAPDEESDTAVYIAAQVSTAAEADEWKDAAPWLTGFAAEVGDDGDIAAQIAAATSAGLQARFTAADDGQLARVLAGYDAAAESAGRARLAAAGHRVDIAHAASDDMIAEMNSRRLSVGVRPGDGEARIGSMIKAGIPVAFGAAGTDGAPDPWGSVRAAVFADDPNERISARAAFTAHTRGGRRVAGGPGDGALVPGAQATFTIWAPTDLLVQVADERIAAWSTDPRSGTPGLPDLADPEFRPTCLSTVRRGRRVHMSEQGRSA
ncbi:amidohydrolase family protein [Spelaeicoccus albus]|uniref:Putative amidohydrolase YtcJ n=2 Tax=Spelaeicoccus albus TaxID=1280376 RepID=A0A7Z0D3V9_9MICO|nr:putative amidohydrolase YtcJ [Spelaeicoccus albus]